jgi:putative transposase
VDEAHCWEAVRYVETNPVRAGLVRNAWDWRWSSAHAHISENDAAGLLDEEWWARRFDPRQWRELLSRGYLEAELAERLREATRTGRPLGHDRFVEELEAKLDRRLRPNKRGPKTKAVVAEGQLSFEVS